MIGSVNVSGTDTALRNRVTGIENRLQTGQTAGLPVFTGSGGAIAASSIANAKDALGISALSAAVAAAPRVSAGSYAGTGGDVTLSFDFTPRVIFIASETGLHVEAAVMYGQTKAVASYNANSGETIDAQWQNNAVTFYWIHENSGTHLEHALGRSGVNYSYFAIGA
ncbi:MAG: hypothetical protein IKD89_07670 [Clostridia bacterium]|nr:hypothetical protein [Clostridia bacterium]